MIHPLSDVHSMNIGLGTTIWQYVVVLEKAIIGKNCNINCHCFIENDVIIGNNVTIKSGIYLWDGVQIENNVFIGPNVTFTNDLGPRSKSYKQPIGIFIKEGASIGASCTILAGVRIGSYAMIGAASNITNDIPDYALAYGNPARIHGWVDELGRKLIQLDETTWKSQEGIIFRKNNFGIQKEL